MQDICGHGSICSASLLDGHPVVPACIRVQSGSGYERGILNGRTLCPIGLRSLKITKVNLCRRTRRFGEQALLMYSQYRSTSDVKHTDRRPRLFGGSYIDSRILHMQDGRPRLHLAQSWREELVTPLRRVPHRQRAGRGRLHHGLRRHLNGRSAYRSRMHPSGRHSQMFQL